MTVKAFKIIRATEPKLKAKQTVYEGKAEDLTVADGVTLVTLDPEGGAPFFVVATANIEELAR